MPLTMTLPEIAQAEAAEEVAKRIVAGVASAMLRHGPDPTGPGIVVAGFVHALDLIAVEFPEIRDAVRRALVKRASR